jgi:AraC-like DNA-binding protein/quercetin dioxygenase-like cupin family protein
MARPAATLPPSSPLHGIRRDYAPYPPGDPAAYDALLDGMAVSDVTAIDYACAPDWRIPPRRIADEMGFLILEGRATMRVEGREAELRPGDLAHWRRGRLHECRHDPRAPITVIALHYTALLEGGLHLAEVAGFPDRFRLGRGSAVEVLAREAAREYALRPRGWQRGIEALATRILLELLRSSAGAMRAGAAPSPGLSRVVPALSAMRDSLPAPLSVPALARRCGLSEAQFRRVFARALGCSPVAHLRRLRLAEACRLLRTTTDTVEAIARRVGYSETAYFANTFTAAMGQAPGAYRRSGGP